MSIRPQRDLVGAVYKPALADASDHDAARGVEHVRQPRQRFVYDAFRL